jgi:hypothetical protein
LRLPSNRSSVLLKFTLRYASHEFAAFKMKEARIIHDNLVVSHMHPNGQVGQPFMELKEVSGFTTTRCALVDSTTGQQIFTVVKEEHTFHPDEYKAYAPSGALMWSLSTNIRFGQMSIVSIFLLHPYQLLD